MTNVNISNEVEDLLMSKAGYMATAITLMVIGLLGFIFNLFVIILMLKDKQLWTPLNIILFNLVCSDFSVSLFGNPFALLSALSHGWIFGALMCQIYGFFMSLLGITSISSLTVLAFERYIMVTQPFQNAFVSKKGAACLVLGIWTYSFALTLPPLIGWGKYVNEAANISCSINWESQTYNAKTYICYLFIFGLILPLLIIMFSYINIVLQIKKNSIRMGQVKKAEKRIAYMVLLMIIAFLTAWTPYAVLALIIQFGDASFMSPGMRVVPSLLAKSSICYNPIIYVGLNAQFQHSLKQRKFPSTNASETFAVCLSKYISQNVDSPMRSPHKMNLRLKEFAKESKKEAVKAALTRDDVQGKHHIFSNGPPNEATQL